MSLALWLLTLMTGSRLKGLLLEGRRHLKAGRYTTALQSYRQVTREWPENLGGYDGMARTYRAMGLGDEARREEIIGQALETLTKQPDHLESRLQLIDAMVDRQMHARALGHVEQALRQAPANLQVLRRAALVLRFNRQFTRALEVLEKALAQEPLSPDLYEQMAFNLRASQRQVQAAQMQSLARALRAVAADPAAVESMERAIYQLTVVGRRNLALPLVDRALAAQPDQPALLAQRGELLLEEGRAQESLASLLRAASLDAAQVKAQALLASAWRQAGDEDRAAWHAGLADMLEKARQSRDQVEAEALRVEVLLRAEQYQQAEQRVDNLLRMFSRDWRGPLAQGRVRQAQGRAGEARLCYRQAALMNERAPEPLMALAWLEAESGRVKEAASLGRQAVALSSRDAKLRRRLAELLEKLGFNDLARDERKLGEALEKVYDDRGV